LTAGSLTLVRATHEPLEFGHRTSHVEQTWLVAFSPTRPLPYGPGC